MSEEEETFEEEEDAGVPQLQMEQDHPEEGDQPEEGGEEERPEGEEGEEHEGEKIPENPLTQEILPECLSLLSKTGDGLAHAYIRLDVHERELTNINILKSYIHLRFVDLSKNNLKDISPLSALTRLLVLKADFNLLTSAKLDEMPYLQMASFSNNKISSTEGCNHPMLEHLNLNNNEITHVTGLDPVKLSRLHTLELRGNKLETSAGIYLPNLKNLFLAANTLKQLEGLQRLTKLTTLHLRENQLEKLDGFSEEIQSLQYINLRANNISAVSEVEKLACLPKLRALTLLENAIAEEDEYRIDVIIVLPKLERLDKDEFTEDERNESKELAVTRAEEKKMAQQADGEKQIVEEVDSETSSSG
ncbi:hypothetical protein CHS0354_016402 [Potamilus streckersoni]|uniref:Leucine-rich repeat-containing protein 23 n=1 Tax=Potamilus streckersoni TaxID=2493646 RepID=A0AAE0SW38_9BIVA|nr:hypothetical protein CHS0354_016402 [Potamilus streckersoni]